MLTAVKNQIRVCVLSLKYNIMREMLNKVSFLTNVIFMMLNNATFIIQWIVLFSIRDEVGGYTMKEVMILWGIAASTYGLSHITAQKAYELPDLIINGKLDSFLVQPKNVLLSVITSTSNTSAIGDLLYGYICICIFSFSIPKLLLFTVFTILGATICTAFAVLMGSMSFWFVRADAVTSNFNNVMVSFATYPDGIFRGAVRFVLYLIIPVGMSTYLPVEVMTNFSILPLIAVLGYTIALCALAAFVFYRGLRRYSSSSLMEARI